MIALERARCERKLSQRQLSAASGVSNGDISRAEKRGMKLYPSQLERIAAVLQWDGAPEKLMEEVAE